MGQPEPLATGVGHAGVTVSDIERSVDFYVRGLGLECVSKRSVEDEYIRRIVQVPDVEAIHVAMLAFPGGDVAVELLQYVGCERHLASARPCDPGAGHVCLLVTDIDAAWERALAAGASQRSPEPVLIDSGPYAGGYGGYLADPDGYIVELLQPPPESITIGKRAD